MWPRASLTPRMRAGSSDPTSAVARVSLAPDPGTIRVLREVYWSFSGRRPKTSDAIWATKPVWGRFAPLPLRRLRATRATDNLEQERIQHG